MCKKELLLFHASRKWYLKERYHIIQSYKHTTGPKKSFLLVLKISIPQFCSLHSPLRAIYGLGICIVLLVIITPLRTKSPTTGWNSQKVPVPHVPRGRFSRIQPCETQYAINAAMDKLVGMGVPSKYFDFPLASLGTLATVMLKRAKRVRPQRTKKVRNRWSAGVRRPIAKAAAAGETPNETYILISMPNIDKNMKIEELTKSARESNSCPIKLLFFLHLATFPSIKSKKSPNGINPNAYHRFVWEDAGPRQ
jgi:hypothetical protein